MSTIAPHHARETAQAIDGGDISGRSWPIDDAYEYCANIARRHSENFPVGSALIPSRLRKHFHAIYAFARTADDFADESYKNHLSEAERLELLAAWGEMLLAAYDGRASHPIFAALAVTCSQFDLPIILFQDLLSAFTQDVTVRRYQTFGQLEDYCRRSANPIGRLVLMVFDYRDQKLYAWSDDICTALQLTNHWQDVKLDLEKDRIYIPVEDMSRFKIIEDELRSRVASPGFQQLMKFEVERARKLFTRGEPLCRAVSGRLALELRAVWLGGMRILERIEQNGYDVFTRRPVITASDKLSITWRALTRRFLANS